MKNQFLSSILTLAVLSGLLLPAACTNNPDETGPGEEPAVPILIPQRIILTPVDGEAAGGAVQPVTLMGRAGAAQNADGTPLFPGEVRVVSPLEQAVAGTATAGSFGALVDADSSTDTIELIARDPATGLQSEPVRVTVPRLGPDSPAVLPEYDPDTGKGVFVDPDPVNADRVIVEGRGGSADAGAEILITNLDNGESTTATADGDGNFKADIKADPNDRIVVIQTKNDKPGPPLVLPAPPRQCPDERMQVLFGKCRLVSAAQPDLIEVPGTAVDPFAIDATNGIAFVSPVYLLTVDGDYQFVKPFEMDLNWAGDLPLDELQDYVRLYFAPRNANDNRWHERAGVEMGFTRRRVSTEASQLGFFRVGIAVEHLCENHFERNLDPLCFTGAGPGNSANACAWLSMVLEQCDLQSCGDGFINLPEEECDDHNTTDGDGCSATCEAEGCGDGVVQAETGETCDDANEINTDACPNGCREARCGDGVVWQGVETCDDGVLNGQPGRCAAGCAGLVPAACGNRVLEGGEACDDGNSTGGDGCSANCTVEACGNGVLDQGEGCDDGNTVGGDGCAPTCRNERCGDGMQQPGEQCDDNNKNPGDGCDENCLTETCGNGIVQAGEACDDGDAEESDACLNDCRWNLCGDGKVYSGIEVCDGGSIACNDGCYDGLQTCYTDCTGYAPCDPLPQRCGNGNIEGCEVCDEGSLNGQPGRCSNDCMTPGAGAPVCGNGIVEAGEECDDGNTLYEDGCKPDCTPDKNPCQPRLIGSIETHYGFKFDIRGHYAYVVGSPTWAPNGEPGNLEIIDLANPQHPVRVGELAGVVHDGGWDIQVEGNYVFINDISNGLIIVDISDSSHPKLASKVHGHFGTMVIKSKIAYVTDGHAQPSTDPYTLELYDVGTPAAPNLIGNVDTGRSGSGSTATWDIDVNNGKAYVLAGSGASAIDIYDITNPRTPVYESTAYVGVSPAQSIRTSGDFIYLDQPGELVVYYQAPGTDFELASRVNLAKGSPWEKETHNGFLYMALHGGDSDGGLWGIYDISGATLPVLAGIYQSGDVANSDIGIYDKYVVVNNLRRMNGGLVGGGLEIYSNAPGFCVPECGNGIAEYPEDCDDGPGGSCLDDCSGYCGNGTVDADMDEVCDSDGGACDDGCYEGTATCAADCTGYLPCDTGSQRCGNDVVEGCEACDDGDENDEPNHCNATCGGLTPPLCGNGVIEPGETCDDGDSVDCGSCNGTCTGTSPVACGNGSVECGEECDDGNTNAGDGCNTNCQNEFVMISAGKDDNSFTSFSGLTCGLLTEGHVQCWGANEYGQATPPADQFQSVSTGGNFACGILADSTVSCWGRSLTGQTSPPAGTFLEINSGYERSCGVRTDHSLSCWPLGIGSPEWSPAGNDFEAVSVGWAHACALRSDQTLHCWISSGSGDDFGQGISPTGTFLAVSSGHKHTCAIRTDQTMQCWGDNEFGQVSPPSGPFIDVGSGANHSCGMRPDHSLECWGANHSSGMTTLDWVTNQAVAPPGIFDALSVGGTHNCALDASGMPTCWGQNFNGQSNTPKSGFLSVSPGWNMVCGIRDDQHVECWGQDRYSTEFAGSPPGLTFSQISTGGFHACGIKTDGKLACWGWDKWGQASPPKGRFVTIASGRDFTCGLRQDLTLTCWGFLFTDPPAYSIPAGQFNMIKAGEDIACALRQDGRAECFDDFASLTPTDQFVSIDVGDGFACGLLTDGTVQCWGGYDPKVPYGGSFLDVSVGYNHACARWWYDSIQCWGGRPKIMLTPPSGNIISFETSYQRNCGVKDNGEAVCWGDLSTLLK